MKLIQTLIHPSGQSFYNKIFLWSYIIVEDNVREKTAERVWIKTSKQSSDIIHDRVVDFLNEKY